MEVYNFDQNLLVQYLEVPHNKNLPLIFNLTVFTTLANSTVEICPKSIQKWKYTSCGETRMGGGVAGCSIVGEWCWFGVWITIVSLQCFLSAKSASLYCNICITLKNITQILQKYYIGIWPTSNQPRDLTSSQINGICVLSMFQVANRSSNHCSSLETRQGQNITKILQKYNMKISQTSSCKIIFGRASSLIVSASAYQVSQWCEVYSALQSLQKTSLALAFAHFKRRFLDRRSQAIE